MNHSFYKLRIAYLSIRRCSSSGRRDTMLQGIRCIVVDYPINILLKKDMIMSKNRETSLDSRVPGATCNQHVPLQAHSVFLVSLEKLSWRYAYSKRVFDISIGSVICEFHTKIYQASELLFLHHCFLLPNSLFYVS